MNDLLTGFLTAALWSTIDYESDEDSLDENYGIGDLSDDFISDCDKLCNDFMNKCESLFTEKELLDQELIGHCLWLTIGRHGAGFFNSEYTNKEKILSICEEYKELDGAINNAIINRN